MALNHNAKKASLAANRTMDIRDFVSTIDWNSRGNNVETLTERLEKAHHYSNHFVNCALNYGEASKTTYSAIENEPEESFMKVIVH